MKRNENAAFGLFPLAFLAQELMLSGFAESGGSLMPEVLVPSALGAGCLAAVIPSFFSGKPGRIIGTAFLALSAFVFAVESTIRTVFRTYMTPGNLFSGAGNVLEHYAGEAARSVPGGVLRFLAFLVPAVLFYLLHRRLDPERNVRRSGANGTKSVLPPVLAAAGILLLGLSARAGETGRASVLYGTQFSFSAGTETFGLLTALQRTAESDVFGAEEESFSFAGAAIGEEPSESNQVRTGEIALSNETGSGTGTDVSKGLGATGEGGASDGNGDAIAMDASGEPVEAAAAEAVPEPPKVYADNVLPLDFSRAEGTGNKTVDGLEAFVQSRIPTKQNEYTGLFQGKNLILICAEAYCGAFIRPDLTPTLWRLVHNGFYFSEYIQPEWGGSTTTGEVAFLLGLSSNDGDETMKKTQGHNNYFTMGNQLQRQGYSSIAFHNGYYNYYSRNLTHENLGYNQYIASGNGLSTLTGHNYPTDTELFEQTLPLYADHEPFSVYYMTVSGHAPYEKNSLYVQKYYSVVDAVLGDEYYTKTKYYICYQMELEEALTALIQGLEERGIADRTVIALTGDHYPYGLGRGAAWHNDQNYIKDLIKDTTEFYWNQDQSYPILWCGSLEGEQKDMACEIDSPVSSLDLLPTLSNLFGLPYDSRLLPGRDVFAPDTEPLVYWNNLSWVTDKGRYDSRKNVYYPRPQKEREGIGSASDARENKDAEEEEAQKAYVEQTHAKVGNLLLFCRTVLRNDYYGLLFGEDQETEVGELLFEK